MKLELLSLMLEELVTPSDAMQNSIPCVNVLLCSLLSSWKHGHHYKWQEFRETEGVCWNPLRSIGQSE